MNKNNSTTNNILVLGGTGKTGSRIASLLWDQNIDVRIGSRKAAIPFDWEDAATWGPALHNISSVYISFQPDLAVPGSDAVIRQLTELAVAKGVKKLVLLSGRGEPEAKACEEIVMNAGVEWTIVRASWFMQNFSESHMLEPVLAGYVSLPAGSVREPFVDADDIAEVAVQALTQDGHHGKVYEVTGPRMLTFREGIAEIAAATGKTIHFEEITIDEYTSQLRMHGVPDDIISLLAYLFTEVLDGRNESLANGVEEALGRKATDFSEYVKKTVVTGIWDQQLAQ